MILLTENQTRAVNESKRSLTIAASAGSGKTRVLTEHIRYLLTDAQVAPYHILAFTFTEKGAGEIRTRLLREKIIPLSEEKSLFVGTIHSFLAGLLRTHAPRLKLDPSFNIMDEAESLIEGNKEIRSFIAKKLTVGNAFFVSLFERFGFHRIERMMERISRHPALWTSEVSDEFLSITAPFFKEALEARIQNGKLNFDDLEILSLRLLREHPDIREKCTQRYRHILVDEFQDTSPLQAALIRALYQPGSNILFIVGDPQQSIYRFRQADAAIFDETSRTIAENGGGTIFLSETFRLSPEITRVVNKVFIPLENFHPMISHHTQERRTGQFKIAVVPQAFKGNAETQRILEAQWIAKKIINLRLPPEELRQTALLFKSGLAIPIFKNELEKRGIPCQMTKTENLLDWPVIRDLIHIISYLTGDTSFIVQVGILRSPFFGFSETFIEEYTRQKPACFDAPVTLSLFMTDLDRLKWEELHKNLNLWLPLVQRLPSSLFIRTLLKGLKKEEGNECEIEQVCYLIDQMELSGPLLLSQLHEKIQSLKKSDLPLPKVHPPSDKGALQLLTIHAAKGLEFKRVILPQLEARTRNDSLDFFINDKKIVFKTEDPSRQRGLKISLTEDEAFGQLKEREDEEKRNESKRLLYVAMTRASEELTLILKEPKKESIDIRNTSNWNQWLWILLEDERNGAEEISQRPDDPILEK